MAIVVRFQGSNRDIGPPPGLEELIGRLPCFVNGRVVVSAWEPSSEEMDEIIRTGRIFVSVMSGGNIFPTFVGSESQARLVVADTGKTWSSGDLKTL